MAYKPLEEIIGLNSGEHGRDNIREDLREWAKGVDEWIESNAEELAQMRNCVNRQVQPILTLKELTDGKKRT